MSSKNLVRIGYRYNDLVSRQTKTMYLHQHTCIQAGPDDIRLTQDRREAMVFDDREWAGKIARLFDWRVFAPKPKQKPKAVESTLTPPTMLGRLREAIR